jgi:multiple sugar transport system ATP-binding protein
MATVRLLNVTRRFTPHICALNDVSFEIRDKEVVTILGPSGCGKSTLLRIIAGLEHPTQGEVWIGNQRVNGIPARMRDVAMVFQSYALYPHMSCHENLALNLRIKKLPREEIERRVSDTARKLEIEDLLPKRPRELSGGQRQRVAVGRALIRDPQVFLFDEPLSNLDPTLRERVRHELKQLFSRLRATVVYVTHDQVEAMTLADRIVVMERGVVQQIGSPDVLYRSPENLFVASFIGSPAMNLLDFELQDGVFTIGEQKVDTGMRISGPVKIGIRPEAVRPGEGFRAAVSLVENLGTRSVVEVRTGRHSLLVMLEGKPSLGSIGLRIDPKDIHVFDKDSGRNLRSGNSRRTIVPQPQDSRLEI